MPRTELDRMLGELRAGVLAMGESVITAIGGAMDALEHQDHRAAEAVIAGDDGIDRACAAIEGLSTHVITLQQPAVRDLRTVLAAWAVAEDLERIGDYAEGIAQLVLRLPHPPDGAVLGELASLAALARVQLQDALDAYRADDAARAREVWAGDSAVDAMHRHFVQALMALMSGNEDALATNTYLLWVAHNLERIADRATNICERVVFIVTGERTIAAAAS